MERSLVGVRFGASEAVGAFHLSLRPLLYRTYYLGPHGTTVMEVTVVTLAVIGTR